MADPDDYAPIYSFSDFQSNSPSAPLPAPPLDNELLNISRAVTSIITALKDIRREDGALTNNIVTYESLALDLQLTFDPTNGQIVAAAILAAQASAAAAAASQTGAEAAADEAHAQALAAAASAAAVDLTLFLPKAGNLDGIGSADTARANLHAAKVDGSDMTGRVAPVTGYNVTDWNTCVQSGWYSGFGAANGPTNSSWMVQTIAYSPLWVTQIAYPFTRASTSTSAVEPYRRSSYDNGGTIAWQPWESMGPVPVGTTIYVNGTTAPPGFLKENGALISRASFPALTTYALSSANLASEATWAAGFNQGFSTGDLSTTIRLPDTRGVFVRNFDDGRGIDPGRNNSFEQPDALKDHTHVYTAPSSGPGTGTTPNYFNSGLGTPTNTSSPSTGAATETRPRNVAKLACIKY